MKDELRFGDDRSEGKDGNLWHLVVQWVKNIIGFQKTVRIDPFEFKMNEII